MTTRTVKRELSLFAGHRVLVMGLGVHGGGLSVTRWLISQGAIVRVTDLRGAAALRSSLRQLPRSRRLRLILGRHRVSDFRWAEVVVRNPAVPRQSPYLEVARRAGARIENEATLFFQVIGRNRIVGVTGTRGKSTTAALIAACLRQRYRATLLAGNIATQPMFVVVGAAQRTRDPVVLELSSWHLEELGEHRRSPHVAVITNVLPDHLDRYPTLAAYAAAKWQIAAHQTADDFLVVNWDNPTTRAFGRRGRGTVVSFALQPHRHVPTAIWRQGEVRWEDGKRSERMIELAQLQLRGEHNLANILAAVAVAKIFGVPGAAVRRAVRGFAGLPYRQQVVAHRGGITYVNDTTATTPEATVAALTTFGATAPGNIVLIAGGSDKRLPAASFRRLAAAVVTHCRAVVLLAGEGSNRIAAALAVLRSPLPVAKGLRGMAEAVGLASAVAQRGDTVLLSPACASFGLFIHEFDRGDQFNRWVRAARSQGQEARGRRNPYRHGK